MENIVKGVRLGVELGAPIAYIIVGTAILEALRNLTEVLR